MNRMFRILSIVLALLLLTACGKTLPAPVEEPDAPQSTEAVLNEEVLTEEVLTEEVLTEEEVQPQPEEPELTVFEGTYRAKVPMDGDEGYVQITAYDAFLLLEHFLCMEGSVYSFWAEEFWPNEDGVQDGEFTTVCGRSQTFSAMTAGDLYDTIPQNRVISLTDDGVVLNYDDSDAEYYVKDETFSYHSEAQTLQQMLGEDVDVPGKTLFGTWSLKTDTEALGVTFREDGTVTFLQKKAGEPVQVYKGIFSAQKDSVSIAAEKIGDGTYPHILSWQYRVDADDMLWLTFEDGQQHILLPTQNEALRSVGRQAALSYIGISYDMAGEYTDQYETNYDYIYRLPQFYGDDAAAMEVNRQIMDKFSPLIEEELGAMQAQEFLSFTEVNFESNIHEGILYLHVYAKTWDWEEHSAYYYDVETGAFLTTEEVLDRLLIDESYFLDAVRKYAQAAFQETFADVPENDKQEYGYYDLLKWTGSDEAVNLQVPIYVDKFGSVVVYARIGSMAGSGIIWEILRPFDGAVG